MLEAVDGSHNTLTYHYFKVYKSLW